MFRSETLTPRAPDWLSVLIVLIRCPGCSIRSYLISQFLVSDDTVKLNGAHRTHQNFSTVLKLTPEVHLETVYVSCYCLWKGIFDSSREDIKLHDVPSQWIREESELKENPKELQPGIAVGRPPQPLSFVLPFHQLQGKRQSAEC